MPIAHLAAWEGVFKFGVSVLVNCYLCSIFESLPLDTGIYILRGPVSKPWVRLEGPDHAPTPTCMCTGACGRVCNDRVSLFFAAVLALCFDPPLLCKSWRWAAGFMEIPSWRPAEISLFSSLNLFSPLLPYAVARLKEKLSKKMTLFFPLKSNMPTLKGSSKPQHGQHGACRFGPIPFLLPC